VVGLIAAAQTLEDLHRLVDRRLLDDHLLQPPRERAILLDVLELSNVVEPTTRSSPAVRTA